MYISEVRIKGFRNFKNAVIPLHEGINMIIGANNSGKSNLLNAIALALNVEGHKKVRIDDFFREDNIDNLKNDSPKILISLTIILSQDNQKINDELVVLGSYLINAVAPYQAKLNFQYSLQSDKEDDYKEKASVLTSLEEIWGMLEQNFARYYKIDRWGGNMAYQNALNRNFSDSFDVVFLDAIRDVGRDMYIGYNPMLKEVLNFFIDYRIKSDSTLSDDAKEQELRRLSENFRRNVRPPMGDIMRRLSDGKDIMLKYASDLGAMFNNAIPDFDGQISESEFFNVLRLILRYNDGAIKIPVTLNGLGYNNLIYISLLLAKMKIMSDTNYMERASKIYSLLLIEEPEAHLHPSMQYQFLNFLKQNQVDYNVQQTIVTTHSTQMLSAAKLDDIVYLCTPSYGDVNVGYPRGLFKDLDANGESKSYIQRYLDATRADIFYAQKLIFVEGMSEVLLLPTFAKYLDFDLVRAHVLVVNMGGRFYDHFLKLFNRQSEYAINKKIACIIDIDPCKGDNARACYPYEEPTHWNDVEEYNIKYSEQDNIKYFSQDKNYGKTLEYNIAFENPKCKLLLTKSLSNCDELKSLMSANTVEDMKNKLRDNHTNQQIKSSIDNSNWNDEDKKKAIIASRYLNSVKKGESALELSLNLEKNLSLEDGDPNKIVFNVPAYIKEALRWLFE